MSNKEPVTVECYGTLQRVPVDNPYITIEKLKSIIRTRFKIDYPFNLTYEGAELCDTDSVHDLSLDTNQPVRVRRCSFDNAYTANINIPDSITDIFLSYEQTDRNAIVGLKTKIQDEDYFCWLDVEQTSSNVDQFSSSMIEQGIQKSTIFLACITARYARSTECRQELSYAKQHGKKIVLLLMESLRWPPHEIGSLVSGLSYIEFYNTTSSPSSTPWPSEKFSELLTKLHELMPQM